MIALGGLALLLSAAGAAADAGPPVLQLLAFLFFLIKLRTVSDGCAPRAIQCSARSSFSVLLSPGFLRIVGPDDLDEFAVARAAAVGHDDFVIRAILRAFSA